MFKPSSKKPALPPEPWTLHLLTTDYLITGSVAPEDQVPAPPAYTTFNRFQVARSEARAEGTEGFWRMRMTSVKVQPTGLLAASDQVLAQWQSGRGELVAVVPGDAASLQAAQDNFPGLTETQEVTVYAGPYAIRGLVTRPPKTQGLFDVAYSPPRTTYPLVNAVVDCLLPGAKLKGWPAPWLLVSGDRVQGVAFL